MNRALPPVVALLLTIAACANAPTVPPVQTGTANPAVSTPMDSPARTAASSPSDDIEVQVPPKNSRVDGSSGSKATLTTLTGVPRPGVESGCWMLDGYLLIGVPGDLLGADLTITVTGRVQDDLMTTCQQGTPLVVDTAAPA